jgi:hypothetical protein
MSRKKRSASSNELSVTIKKHIKEQIDEVVSDMIHDIFQDGSDSNKDFKNMISEQIMKSSIIDTISKDVREKVLGTTHTKKVESLVKVSTDGTKSTSSTETTTVVGEDKKCQADIVELKKQMANLQTEMARVRATAAIVYGFKNVVGNMPRRPQSEESTVAPIPDKVMGMYS